MTRYLNNTARFVAVVRGDAGKVIPVSPTDLPRVVEEEQIAGATVVGDFAFFRDAERAARHARRGRSRQERRKTA